MSALAKDRKLLPLTLTATAACVTGVVWLRWDRGEAPWQAALTAVGGIALLLLACWLHDRAHRRSGEPPHLLTGHRRRR